MRSRMIAFALGIGSISFMPVLPSLSHTLVVVFLTLLVYYRHRTPFILTAIAGLSGLAYGILYGQSILSHILPNDYQQQPLWVEGVVVGFPVTVQEQDRIIERFDLSVTELDCPETLACDVELNRIRLSSYSPLGVLPGELWRLPVKLKRPHGMFNPAGFDYQAWLIQRRYSATGYVLHHDRAINVGQHIWAVDSLRWQVSESLKNALHNLSNQGLIVALLWADRSAIAQEQWALFRDTGTSHLMVISGLHIGLVSGFLFLSGRLIASLFACRFPDRYAAALSALGAVGYAFMAGFSLPTQRAVIMVLVLLAARSFNRKAMTWNALFIALVICLMIDPLAPVGASFWLSFAAVAIIIFGTNGRYPALSSWRKGVFVQWMIFFGMIPVLAVAFGQISLVSPVCNFFSVPIFSVVVVPGLLIATILSVLEIGWVHYLWNGLDWVLDIQLSLLSSIVNQVGGGQHYTPEVSGHELMIAIVGAVTLLMPMSFKLKLISLIALLPLLFTKGSHLGPGDVRMTVLDVGQGLSVLVETSHHALVYDLGPVYSSGFSTTESVVLPVLRSKGIGRIDTVVISHSDSDHSGNWPMLLEQIAVRQIETGEPAYFDTHVPTKPCHKGRSWQWDGVTFTYLHPPDTRTERLESVINNRSCVLMIEAAGTRFLLPGDIERKIELALYDEDASVLEADVLIAPHHGSATSSSWPFTRAVAPEHVVYSVGYLNRFGHPKPHISDRYERLTSELYRTDRDGAIVFEVKGGKLRPVTRFRDRKKRFWH